MNIKVLKTKNKTRIQRKRRIRGKISGSATCPRLSVFRSNRSVSAQAIDDTTGTTLASVYSKALNLKANKDDAAKLGEAMAAALKTAGISAVTFDRNGYIYHGVVKAFGDAVRANEIRM
jgi:large subunit ribosomal protein L18